MMRASGKVSGLVTEVNRSQGMILRDYAMYLPTRLHSAHLHLPGNRQDLHSRGGTADRLLKSGWHTAVNIRQH